MDEMYTGNELSLLMEIKSDIPCGPFFRFSLMRCASFLNVKYSAVNETAKADIDIHSEKNMLTLLNHKIDQGEIAAYRKEAIKYHNCGLTRRAASGR